MLNNLKVKELIKNRDINLIRKLSEKATMSEIIAIFDTFSDMESVLFFRFLTTDKASEVFSHLDEEMQKNIIQNLTKKETSSIVNELYTDEIADLIEELPLYLSEIILLAINKNKRNKVNELLKYSEDQVGSIMSVDMILLKKNYSNKIALQKIKEKREESEISQIFFVVDSENKLLGSITLEDIVFSPKDKSIIDNIKRIESVFSFQDKEEASQVFISELSPILPVVNKDNVVLGVLTHDDVIDIINEEATEDIYKSSGISSKEVIPYQKAKILEIVKSRIFWLLILMMSATLSQIIIDSFSSITSNFVTEKLNLTLSTTILLGGILSIIPVLSSSAGNAGSQASSTITRSIALNGLKKTKFSKVILKEFKVGLILGIILMFANFGRLMVYYLITGELLAADKLFFLIISAASSLSLFVIIILAKISGAIIPMLGVKWKKDPAVMSSPVLTTIIDALSTLIFFGITLLMLLLI